MVDQTGKSAKWIPPKTMVRPVIDNEGGPATTYATTASYVGPDPSPPIQPQEIVTDRLVHPTRKGSNIYSKPPAVESPAVEFPAVEFPIQYESICGNCGKRMPYDGSPCPSCTEVCDQCHGAGCTNCGVAGASGEPHSLCPLCGLDGCHDPESIAEQFAECGTVSAATRYVVAEGLYLTRRDGTIANSNFGALSNFDWTGGARVTLGHRMDQIQGNEFSYFGTNEFTQGNLHIDPVGRINARFTAGDGFLNSEISAFKNAVVQAEQKQSEIHSLEFNRVTWGWDVVKNYVGIRYIYNEDSYVMASRNALNESGLFEVYVTNNLIGPNFGSEMYYDVGYRLSGTFVARGGLYASLGQVRTKLNNGGTQFLDVEDNASTLGGTLELGFNGRFKLAKRTSLRFGYNFLWLDRVSEAANNVPRVITPSIGSDASNANQMQYQGANLGLEIFW